MWGMRKILPERTVATLVELLRAYKRKAFPAMDAAERVAELLGAIGTIGTRALPAGAGRVA